MAFVIQNSPDGILAIGRSGSGLGYFGPPDSVSPSIAVGLSAYDSAPPGGKIHFRIGQNASWTSKTSVLNNILGCPTCSTDATWNFVISISYSGALLSYTITNTATMKNFSDSVLVNIPAVLHSNFAWVGFSGGTGGATQTCEVTAWAFCNPTASPSLSPSTTAPSTLSPLAGSQITASPTALPSTQPSQQPSQPPTALQSTLPSSMPTLVTQT